MQCVVGAQTRRRDKVSPARLPSEPRHGGQSAQCTLAVDMNLTSVLRLCRRPQCRLARHDPRDRTQHVSILLPAPGGLGNPSSLDGPGLHMWRLQSALIRLRDKAKPITATMLPASQLRTACTRERSRLLIHQCKTISMALRGRHPSVHFTSHRVETRIGSHVVQTSKCPRRPRGQR